jgi:hypothetical protein
MADTIGNGTGNSMELWCSILCLFSILTLVHDNCINERVPKSNIQLLTVSE